MKKLMIAAAAAAMGLAANAADGYVYKFSMDVETTIPDYCEEAVTGACGDYEAGILVRVKDTYAVRGFLYGCASNCWHLAKPGVVEGFMNAAPFGYSLGGSTANGIILWDALHRAPIVPVAFTKWNEGAAGVFAKPFMNVVGKEFDRSEMVMDFAADVKFYDETKAVTNVNTFALKLAGFGTYDKEHGVWTRTAGLAAGTMSAPWVIVKDDARGRYVMSAVQAFGYNCLGAACGTGTTETTATAAYGTWSLTYDRPLSVQYGTRYTAALTEVPDYAEFE